MNKLIYAILAIISCASCSKNLNITGSTDSQTIDGSTLYLRVNENGDSKVIDSCDVVHGQFKFNASFDSTRVAMICNEQEGILPVVLEEGDIKVVLNNTEISCTGTALNDSLNTFLKSYDKINSQLMELVKQSNNAEYRYYTEELADPEAEQQKILEKRMQLDKDMDNLFTGFVQRNFENILGPYIFLLRASIESGGYYELTPWVESILAKATKTFKENPDVKEFVTNAQRNKNIENGTETPVQAPINGATPQNIATPTEMAGGAKQ